MKQLSKISQSRAKSQSFSYLLIGICSLVLFQNCGSYEVQQSELISIKTYGRDGEVYYSKAGHLDPETGEVIIGGDVVIGTLDDLGDDNAIDIRNGLDHEGHSVSISAFFSPNEPGVWPSPTITSFSLPHFLPYVFHPSVSGENQDLIREVMEDFNSVTNAFGINLKAVEGKADFRSWIEFRGPDGNSKNRGCYVRSLGRKAGANMIYLENDGCYNPRVVLHEVMHILGYRHEHQRPNRDRFIEILPENIDPEFDHAFAIIESGELDTRYDHQSIMHYHGFAFSKNDEPTIIDQRTGQPSGYNRFFSSHDIQSLAERFPMPDALPPHHSPELLWTWNFEIKQKYNIFYTEKPMIFSSADTPNFQLYRLKNDFLLLHPSSKEYCSVRDAGSTFEQFTSYPNYSEDLLSELADYTFSAHSEACFDVAVSVYRLSHDYEPTGITDATGSLSDFVSSIAAGAKPLDDIVSGQQVRKSEDSIVLMRDPSNSNKVCSVPGEKTYGVVTEPEIFVRLENEARNQGGPYVCSPESFSTVQKEVLNFDRSRPLQLSGIFEGDGLPFRITNTSPYHCRLKNWDNIPVEQRVPRPPTIIKLSYDNYCN